VPEGPGDFIIKIEYTIFVKHKLSVTILAKDSSSSIESTLKSAYGWVDEIIIAGHSTYPTQELAKKYKAAVCEADEKNEGLQKALGLSKAKSEWVLALECGEIVSIKLKSEILHEINKKNNKLAGYKIPFQNYYMGKPLSHGGENYSLIRLFKKDKVRIRPLTINAQYEIKSGDIGELDNSIVHHYPGSLIQIFTRLTSDAIKEATERKTQGEKTSLKKILAHSRYMFLRRFVKDQGYKDGLFRLPLDIAFAYMEFLTWSLIPFVNKNTHYTKVLDIKAKDISPDYHAYLRKQHDVGAFESQNAVARRGQERYVESNFLNIPRNSSIVDVGCGDGVALQVFKKLGFTTVMGVDMNREKIKVAKETGYEVLEADMQNLNMFKAGQFDIVYCSHTLEHAYYPSKVLKEFNRILKSNGELYVVLPYPDTNYLDEEGHVAKYELGLNVDDKGEALTSFFQKNAFKLVSIHFDTHREPEVWLRFRKNLK